VIVAAILLTGVGLWIASGNRVHRCGKLLQWTVTPAGILRQAGVEAWLQVLGYPSLATGVLIDLP
jgi:hypothetical protein